MTTDLQLFRVTVTQTWSAEAEALVMALDRASACRMAERNVQFDLMDAEGDGTSVDRAILEPFDTILTLTKKKAADLWLILPDRTSLGCTVELDEFCAAFSTEQLETLRIAAIEKDNGHLTLLEAFPPAAEHPSPPKPALHWPPSRMGRIGHDPFP